MTRWARVGNSQKHKKIPEDATPWEDFWQNRNQNSTGDGDRNKVKSGRIEKKKQKLNKKFGLEEKRKGFENPENNKVSKFRNAEQQESESSHTSPKFSPQKKIKEEQLSTENQVMSKKQQRKAKKKERLQQLKNNESGNQDADTSNVSDSIEDSQMDVDNLNTTESQVMSKKQQRKAKKREKLQQLKNTESGIQDADTSNISDSIEVSQMDVDNLNTTESQVLSKKQLKKAKKKEKLQQLKNTESVDVQDPDDSNVTDRMEASLTESKSPKEKDFQGKKKLFMKKLEKKRKENGITLLPAKVERKLYIIKRRLREKGLPPAAIKDIARKERRKEELKFRGSISTKPCFNCRQVGHLLADCPKNQDSGLCFKCGSAGHTSYKCPKKIEGYPLAKCFVCKEQGHISRDCPQNKHGIYIKGGKCGLCGNVNHLKKDCPTLRKKNDEETDITAYTINDDKSVDAEIVPVEDVKPNLKPFMKKGKKAKLVKF